MLHIISHDKWESDRLQAHDDSDVRRVRRLKQRLPAFIFTLDQRVLCVYVVVMAKKGVKLTNGASCDEEGGTSISGIEDKGLYDEKEKKREIRNDSNDIVDNHNKIRVIAASPYADENDSYSDPIYQ